jgi:cellulose synthase/poly-beta-1,6-N-acetylglucosamine synthase-like glycosyltransferase
MFYFAISVGIVFCSFWLAQLIFVKFHLNWTNKIIKSDQRDEKVGVSIIHPIKDLDFEIEKNLESWMNQDYRGAVEHIFSFQDPDDPAIPVVKKFMTRYPEIDMQITVNPIMEGLNGKSSNMVNGMKLSKYDIVLFGDSDVRVKPDFIVKMVRPLKDEKVGITTCGQINIGGKDFWTRFFTFTQNSETDFIWAFLTKLGFDLGATGAAFAMRKKLLLDIGGLEAFGGSLLEDLHLGNTLYKMGYKLVLGPFIECHVDKLAKEKSLNYAKRIGVGIKTHLALELPAFILMLFWYWIIFILAVVFTDERTLYLSFAFMGLRVVQGLAMRMVTMNRIMPIDLIMSLFFDLFGTFYLFYSLDNPYVTWRGIRYEVKAGGFIEDLDIGDEPDDDSIIEEDIIDKRV